MDVGVGSLERVANRGWRAPEEAAYGDWLLRAGDGFTARANSVLVLGTPPGPLPEAVDAVAGWYSQRGLQPCAQLPGPQSAAADDAFAAAGWERHLEVLVLPAPLTPPAAPDPRVVLHDAPDDAWLRGCRYDGAALPPTARTVITGADPVAFASVRVGGEVVAVARGTVDEGWLGVSTVTVADGHRRRGLATALSGALQHWAAVHGASRVYLQVLEDNAPARELYARSGFTEHHRYHYRRAPQG